ncbi:MAG TPA: PAS domain S-box protein [Leptospiraceae bacterium]|nr:PAS domain S-box protein [Leptospiraceae bacterium]HNL02110.1 PAS domain S-box protein [Leptospiraceae bacterium]
MIRTATGRDTTPEEIQRLLAVTKEGTGFEIVVGRDVGDRFSIFASSERGFESLDLPWTSDRAVPMKRALKGETGHDSTVDYEGKEVIAAYAPVPDLHLGLVAKMDRSVIRELYFYSVILSILLAAALSILVSVIVWRVSRISLEKRILRPTLSRYELMLNRSPHCIHEMGPNGAFISMNDAGLRMIRKRKEEIEGLHCLDLVHHSDQARVKMLFERALKGEPVEFEFKMVSGKSARSDFTPWKNEAGKVTRIIGTTVDLSDELQAAENVRTLENLLMETERISQTGSWSLDLKTGELVWSREIYHIFEIEPEFEPSYEEFVNSIHPEDREFVNTAYRESVSSRQQFDVTHRLLMTDGRTKYVREHGITYYDGEGAAVRSVGTVQDITARIAAETKLAQSEAKYRLLFESSPDAIQVVDPVKLTRLEFNDVSAARLGYTREEYASIKVGNLSDPTTAETFIQNIIRDGEVGAKGSIRKKDGGLLHVHTMAKKIEINGQTYLYMISRDITAEENALSQIAENLEKEKELNRLRSDFVSMISHQFRTPLATMHSSLQIMQIYSKNGHPPEKMNDHLTRIGNEILRLTQLTEDVLTMGKYAAGAFEYKPQVSDIGCAIGEILAQRFHVLYPQRQCQLERVGQPRKSVFDSVLMTHIFTNLISNAYQYSSGPPRVVVNYVPDEVFVDVIDDGIGISEEDLGRIFRPFFRGHNALAASGTGLGLAIVQQFLEMHGASISVQSELNHGTTFRVHIPDTQEWRTHL